MAILFTCPSSALLRLNARSTQNSGPFVCSTPLSWTLYLPHPQRTHTHAEHSHMSTHSPMAGTGHPHIHRLCMLCCVDLPLGAPSGMASL